MDYQNLPQNYNNFEDKSYLSLMTLEEKIKLTNQIYISYPRFQEVLSAIDYCHHFSSCQDEPECLFLTGETGVGKTTIYRTYAYNYPRKMTNEGAIIPILAVTIPAPATVKTVVTKMLWQLGDPAYDKGTIGIQTIRLIGFLKNCGVELIILDEFQHFIDRDSAKVLQTVSDWLKTLILDTNLPIILIGLPEAEQILKLKSLSQLSRRFAHRYYLRPFIWEVDNGVEFRTFLHLLESELPLKEKSHLAEEEMAKRFYVASGGIIAYIMKLIRAGTYLALTENSSYLNVSILANAFTQYVQADIPSQVNPFLVDLADLKDIKTVNVSLEIGATNSRLKSQSFALQSSHFFKR